jgi:uncharacterized protein YjbI with pentapeptide repeats
MSPEVTAAVIAASVGVLTLIGTLAAQYFGRRATSQDTQKALEGQREQLKTTLAAQREQLDKTLAEQRTRTLNERFATAAGQLGDDKPPAVRLAGVYAMAGLADDWPENRQTCVDVLCAYLRLPYAPDPGNDASAQEQLDFQGAREVRHTAIRVITAHLKDGAAVPWQGLDFDFTGVVFDGGDFRGARFSGGTVDFNGAVFSGGTVDFSGAEFQRRSTVSFSGARFTGGTVSFDTALFSGGEVGFPNAKFSGGMVSFDSAVFFDSTVGFGRAVFSGGTVSFDGAGFSSSYVEFLGAMFSGGMVSFDGAGFSGGTVGFAFAVFSGGTVDFLTAQFSGGVVDFSRAEDWSSPPAFSWGRIGKPRRGVKLPKKEDQSQA